MRRALAVAFLAAFVGPLACSGGSLVMAPMLAPSAVAVLPPPAASADAGPSPQGLEPAGRWVGRGQQSDGQGWDIALEVTSSSGALRARVTYPQLECGGEWNLEAAGARQWVGREHIAYGTDSCVENGIVHLHLTEAGVLEFDWREVRGRGSTARGTLRRVGSGP